MRSFLAGLSPRERNLVIGGALFVIAAGLYFLFWKPLTAHVEQLEQRVTESQALYRWMQQAADEVHRLKGTSSTAPGVRGGASLLGLINQTARSVLKDAVLKRVEEDQRDTVRVWIEQAGFDDLVLWLASLRRQYAVEVSSIVVDRTDEPGRVNVQLILERPPA